jgi:ABC-type glycerol-3-phosphate transport system permease component
MRPSRAGTIAAYATLIVAIVIALFPVFWTATTSIKQPVDTLVNPPKFVSFDATFKNYRALWEDTTFRSTIQTTVIVTVVSTLISVLAGALAGYALARQRRFPGRRPLEATLVLVRAMPGVAIVVPLYVLVSKLHLYDSTPTLIFIYAAINVPFAAWLMTSFMATIPLELEQAAAIDGAGRLRTLWSVVVPLAAPGFAATSIFVALLAWNEFLIPVVLTATRARTLPVAISAFVGSRVGDWGPLAAASSIAIVPIAILTVLIQRRLVGGLAAGAVKD